MGKWSDKLFTIGPLTDRQVTLLVKILKVRNDHRSKFSNLSNWKEEA